MEEVLAPTRGLGRDVRGVTEGRDVSPARRAHAGASPRRCKRSAAPDCACQTTGAGSAKGIRIRGGAALAPAWHPAVVAFTVRGELFLSRCRPSARARGGAAAPRRPQVATPGTRP